MQWHIQGVNFKYSTLAKPESRGAQINGVEMKIIDCNKHDRGEVRLPTIKKLCADLWTDFDPW